MGIKISEIVTANPSPTNDDRFEISRKLSSSPDVWDTQYIEWIDLTNAFLEVATLQDVISNGNIFTGTMIKDSGSSKTAMSAIDEIMYIGSADQEEIFTANRAAYLETKSNGTSVYANLETFDASGGGSIKLQTAGGVTTAVVTGSGSFAGVKYAADNSANYTTRSLIDKGYADLTYAPKASPTFTGTPSLPTGTTGVTQSANDNSTKLATTAYVDTTSTKILRPANNLSDLGSAITARDNLGAPFVLITAPSTLSPADSTTYYSGYNGLVPSTTASNHAQNVGYAFKIIGVILTAGSNTVAGTSENITLQIRNVTQASSSSVGVFQSNGGSSTVAVSFTFTGLSISIGASDTWCAQFDTPAWVTNPTGVAWRLQLLCIRQ